MNTTCIAGGPSELEGLVTQLRHTADGLREAVAWVDHAARGRAVAQERSPVTEQWWPEARACSVSTVDGLPGWARAFASNFKDQREASR